jgi:PilZ domain
MDDRGPIYPERRRARRYRVAVPVELEGVERGLTRDISTSGVFFETTEALVRGAPLTFSLFLEQTDLSGPVWVVCTGQVVRVDRRPDGVGVAATIESFRFDPDEAPIA